MPLGLLPAFWNDSVPGSRPSRNSYGCLRLRTPLQVERHLTLAFEEGFRVGGEKPLTVEVVEAVLSSQLDDVEPRLTRHGYSVRTLSEQFNARPAEIKRLLRGELDAARTRELADEMRAAGLPL